MTDSYDVLDGWGGSGTLSTDDRPKFEDVAVDVPSYGTSVDVTMFYPDGE